MNVTVDFSSILGRAGGDTKLERIDPQLVLVLGLCTLGLYPLYKFYRVAMQYQALAGRASQVQVFLGSYLGAHLLGVLTLRWYVGIFFLLGSVLAGLFALNEVLALRRTILEQHGLDLPQLHESDAQRACWVAASLLSWAGVGVIPAAIQCWWFFRDHAALAETMAAQRRQQPPHPRAA
ncbi:hypothetical protein [Vulgatibacter sp.]|uniref:hypothetical protein n=1 Tax=Vulgatibacter sp. TaxID=1971226 RepID=UPI0035620AA9